MFPLYPCEQKKNFFAHDNGILNVTEIYFTLETPTSLINHFYGKRFVAEIIVSNLLVISKSIDNRQMCTMRKKAKNLLCSTATFLHGIWCKIEGEVNNTIR